MRPLEKTDKSALIPIIVDVERNIDGHQMIRCSYYSIQSDSPLPNWSLDTDGESTSMLLLNLEAILIGSPNSPTYFRNVSDVEMMYNFVEKQDALFVDINDIWVPKIWFGVNDFEQGQLFRISQERFSQCWKLRHDIISSEEFFDAEKMEKQSVIEIQYSKEETEVFTQWTEDQINRSQEIYKNNRSEYLQKVKG